ncbi:MAG: hypothetical protein AAB629_02645, partial [Patescibacteria group bacterium]
MNNSKTSYPQYILLTIHQKSNYLNETTHQKVGGRQKQNHHTYYGVGLHTAPLVGGVQADTSALEIPLLSTHQKPPVGRAAYAEYLVAPASFVITSRLEALVTSAQSVVPSCARISVSKVIRSLSAAAFVQAATAVVGVINVAG